MRPVVADASALAAIAFGEEESERILARLDGVTIHAPRLLRYELASVAVKKARRYPDHAARIFAALDAVLDRRRGIRWHDVQSTDVALLATATGLSAYDASYLWLAGSLEADLVTLDRRLAAASADDFEILG